MDTLTEHVVTPVSDLKPGDVVRFDGHSEWVTVLKRKRDRYGYDVLYEPFNQEPRWRGFDNGDKVMRKVSRETHTARHLTKQGTEWTNDLGETFPAELLHRYECSCSWKGQAWYTTAERAYAHFERHLEPPALKRRA